MTTCEPHINEKVDNDNKVYKWYEWSKVRMVYTWYEKSVVRIVNGTKSSDTLQLQRRFCVTDRAGGSPSPRPQPTAKRSSSLPFNDIHPHNPCNYMDYY